MDAERGQEAAADARDAAEERGREAAAAARDAAEERGQEAAAAGRHAAEGVNQGATGTRPIGESPLSATTDSDLFDERPEAFVGAAFAGGLVLALILRKIAQ
jgi:hypothetical protein